MSWIGYLLWFGLAASVIFTTIGIGFQSPWHLAIAAMLSGIFSVAAMFSIGIFILPICILQVTLAWRIHREQARTHQTPPEPPASPPPPVR